MPRPDRSALLVDPRDLAALLSGPNPPLVLDVRWRLDRPDGRPEYLAGHLPGAVYVDLDHELASHGAPVDGRHPLPTVEVLQHAARRWGLRRGRPVVAYDDAAQMPASRARWLLRYAGVSDVRLLDGGYRGWVAAGLPVETGEPVAPEPGDIELEYGALPVLSIGEAAALPSGGTLLDARAPERYRGEVEPMDPRAGHIPGARNAPAASVLDADGRFLDADELRARFEALGVQDDAPVGAYCGSGVSAATTGLALELAGYEPALYPGSWSQWSNHPDRPVATGPDAG
ncbi:sulfurtransferase [Agromyces intestinalis]|uniref:Sulfurtransferase n=1 Tax=Agromyces intestinalis TaxID=2592652 RepID=A0A5C1YG03_9MICO|nr:sulfurtransferase [Agromyces intestinalis]QEO15054.1 sulfurtransferase [Agromyces intestinalis]